MTIPESAKLFKSCYFTYLFRSISKLEVFKSELVILQNLSIEQNSCWIYNLFTLGQEMKQFLHR